MEFNQIELAPLTPLDAPATDNAPGDSEVFVPQNVCPKMIRYAVEDNKLVHLDFAGGCDGNLKAISALVEGMEIEQVVEKLSGITCGKKDTSCVDQLCIALKDQS